MKKKSPRGQILSDLLGVVDIQVTPEIVMKWTTKQREKAEKWAARSHLRASDNDIFVPKRPSFLDMYDSYTRALAKKSKDDPWLQGFSCACGIVAQLDSPELAQKVVAEGGFNLKDLKKEGAEEYDIDLIKGK